MRILRGFLVLALSVSSGFAQGVLTTLAGTDWLFPGDGRPALQAPLGGASSLDVATDKNGNYYVCDADNAMVMRVGPDGIINVVAGNGLLLDSGDGGFATNASLGSPNSIALDAAGNLYIATYGSVRKVTIDGIIHTIAGTSTTGYSGDGGLATAAQVGQGTGIAVDSAGNVYISDYIYSVVRRISTDGIITTIAGTGQSGFSGDKGAATAAKLNHPQRISVDASGNIFIADTSNGRVRKVAGGIIDTVAGGGTDFSEGAVATSAGILPLAVAVTPSGDLYVADGFAVGIRHIVQGKINTIAGSGMSGFAGDGGPALKALFDLVAPGIAMDSAGSLLLADDQNRRVRKVTSDGNVQTIAGNGLYRFAGDGGPATSATLYVPTGIAIDSDGNTYVTETFQSRIRRIAKDGTISVYAGTGFEGYTGDGGPAAQATLFDPTYLTIGLDGNLYISDRINGAIRKIDKAGNISTYARIANPLGSFGNVIPDGIAFDDAGQLLIADGTSNRLVFLDAAVTTFTTFAGTRTAGFSGDGGPAISAALNNPVGLRYYNGYVYFCDSGNNRVRRISIADATISTFAGNGQAAYTGDGGLATQASLNNPQGLNFDSSGNLYIADQTNFVVRKVAPDGTISTFAGNPRSRILGDGALATATFLGSPSDIAIDAAGNVLIADAGFNRVREVIATQPAFQVSTNTLTFTAPAGSSLLSQDVALASAIAGLPFTGTASVKADGPSWITLTPPSGLMPSTLKVNVDPSQLAAGANTGTVTITSPNANPPSKTISITLTTTAPGQPSISVKPSSLTFPFVVNGAAKSRAIAVTNAGGGSLSLNIAASTSSGGGWLKISSTSLTVGAFGNSSLNITADPSALKAGTYSGAVTVTSVNPSQSVTVPVTITVSAVAQTILIPQTGLTFTSVLGGGSPLPQFFNILNTGQGQMQWSVSATTLSGGPWLSPFPLTGVTDANSPIVPTVRVDINPKGLNPGVYAGTVQVTAPGADNSPQFVSVFLNVVTPGTDVGPIVQPAGFVFSAPAGGQSPGSQTILIQGLSATPVTFQATAVTQDGQNWLTLLPSAGSVTATQSARIVVQPVIDGLAAGVYRGNITVKFQDGSAANVGVLLIIVGVGGNSNIPSAAQAGGGCNPQSLNLVFSVLPDGFQVPAGFPGQVAVKAFDNCANPMTTGSVILDFSNGDPSLRLDSLKDGTWAQTWTPQHNATSVTVTANAAIPDTPLTGTAKVTGSLLSFDAPPALAMGGIVNAASYAGEAVAPGSLISLFGSRMGITASASTVPLPTNLGGASIAIAGQLVPLTYMSDGQVNAMVPYGVSVNTSMQAIVTRGASYSAPQSVTLSAAAPGVFTKDGNGQGQGLVFVADASGVQTLADTSHPAKAGDAIVIYCTGLGQVNPPVTTGTAAPLAPLSNAVNAATVTVGGQNAPVFFAGLTPQFVGLYQVNAIMPSGVTAGSQVPVVVTAAGQSSKPVTIAVK